MKNLDIETIYKLYPTKCLVRGASSGKSKNNKNKIKILLKEYTVIELGDIIKRYCLECVKDNVYMKNFSTFLNNVPDYEAEQSELEMSDEDKYLTQEERDNPDDNFRQRRIYLAKNG